MQAGIMLNKILALKIICSHNGNAIQSEIHKIHKMYTVFYNCRICNKYNQ